MLPVHTEETIEAMTEMLANHPHMLDEPNEHGCTALIIAAFNGNKKLVQFLCDKGADLDAEDDVSEAAAVCPPQRCFSPDQALQ